MALILLHMIILSASKSTTYINNHPVRRDSVKITVTIKMLMPTEVGSTVSVMLTLSTI